MGFLALFLFYVMHRQPVQPFRPAAQITTPEGTDAYVLPENNLVPLNNPASSPLYTACSPVQSPQTAYKPQLLLPTQSVPPGLYGSTKVPPGLYGTDKTVH